ncbi:hypothetical protein ASD00_31525 [Ensifer sp. Root31]|uniref:tautomerase family protein n=1 Tax=Ensifer sp. Root31 TaxID=1736512 RepID=UPI00070D5BE0|nr:tautomerase family protein [Ensifer sp. Root31]KQU86418.1 hypothetical protein ASD00_31525 [Ensifer sp. Root31]
MPIVRISLFPGRDQERKDAVASEITKVFSIVMGIPAADTIVLFEEIEKADWYRSGVPYTQNVAEPPEKT